MKKRLLMRLVKLLEADAKNPNGLRFDMGTWGHSDAGPILQSCGTTACAMGLAVISGAFSKEGLKNEFKNKPRKVAPVMPDGSTGYGAAAALFDIDYCEADYLFSPTAYRDEVIGARGERLVARRIRKFVERGGMPRSAR